MVITELKTHPLGLKNQKKFKKNLQTKKKPAKIKKKQPKITRTGKYH
jgi:hypothetical protein